MVAISVVQKILISGYVYLLKCPWPKSVPIVQVHLLSLEMSEYPLDNSLSKITYLQLRSEAITPPQGVIPPHLSIFLFTSEPTIQNRA